MLKIHRATESIIIDRVVALVYGPPGVGKSSLVFTSDDPLVFDFDRGAHRSHFRGDIVQVESWSELAGLNPARDFAGYKTIGIDTVGRMLDAMTLALREENPKNAKRDGGLTMQGWGALKSKFVDWVNLIRASGLDLVFVAHEREDRKADDSRITRPDIPGGSYAEVFKSVDAIGYMSLSGRARTLDFNPTDEWIAKNPCGFEAFEIPDFHSKPRWMGSLIADLKAGMGRRSEESAKEAGMVEDWRGWATDASSPDALNRLKESLVEGEKGMPRGVFLQAKQLLLEVAASRGWRYNVKALRFESGAGTSGAGTSGIVHGAGGSAGEPGVGDAATSSAPPASPATAPEPEADDPGPGGAPGGATGPRASVSAPAVSAPASPPENASTGPGAGVSGDQASTHEGPGPGPTATGTVATPISEIRLAEVGTAVVPPEYLRRGAFAVWTDPAGRRRAVEIVDVELVDGRASRAIVQPVKEADGTVPEEEMVPAASLERHVSGEVNGRPAPGAVPLIPGNGGRDLAGMAPGTAVNFMHPGQRRIVRGTVQKVEGETVLVLAQGAARAVRVALRRPDVEPITEKQGAML